MPDDGKFTKYDDAPKLDRNPPFFEAAMQEKREQMNTEEIRQGKTGLGVRYVLATSLAGALLALGGIYAYFIR